MLYMKEMRAKVVAECTLKESAAINQILGRRVSILDSKSFAKFLAKFKRKPKNIGSISPKKNKHPSLQFAKSKNLNKQHIHF